NPTDIPRSPHASSSIGDGQRGRRYARRYSEKGQTRRLIAFDVNWRRFIRGIELENRGRRTKTADFDATRRQTLCVAGASGRQLTPHRFSSSPCCGKSDQMLRVIEDAVEDVVEVDIVGESDVAITVAALSGKPLGLLLQPLQHDRSP